MERNVVIANSVLIAYLISLHAVPGVDANDVRQVISIGWLLPPVISFLAMVRWRESLGITELIAEYIRRFERTMAGPAGGWECFIKEQREGRGDGKGRHQFHMLSLGSLLFWILSMAGTVVLAVVRIRPGDWISAAIAGLGAALLSIYVVVYGGLVFSVRPVRRA